MVDVKLFKRMTDAMDLPALTQESFTASSVLGQYPYKGKDTSKALKLKPFKISLGFYLLKSSLYYPSKDF